MDYSKLPWIDAADSEAQKHAMPYVPTSPIILEAGACAAEDTLRFKSLWPDCEVYCFEPNPDLFEIATRNTKDQEGVHLYPYALADFVGKRNFYMNKGHPATSSFYPDNWANVDVPQSVLASLKVSSKEELPSRSPDDSITVQCITIDEWRTQEGVDRIDYLWLDTEGAELMALKGAADTLPGVAVIHVEMNCQEFRKGMAQFEELYEFLTSNGFDLFVVWQAHRNWQANGIFVKKGML